ncbi:unnamed protein product (macronuclear) [Paramecium tetraurelia]|uniref:Uncharacterized protein n=1 Tax=Paramecium tetraurelia TaxID=5888 RepID=A0EIG2_PARTE|nr:uncharacterized protein GSPATT00027432001 [Paramecium tetraurelia]CAK95103.1 unnamed protein product [Paramecium tetraurelia]|eukprot:XP_001462476.1 hypothetical protein (macronuclear) [Paramecium tetraurelia strain d4-2]
MQFRRKQSEQQLGLLMNRLNLIQQNQLKVIRRIKQQQKSVEMKQFIQSEHDQFNQSRNIINMQKLQKIHQVQLMAKTKKHQSEEGRKKTQEQQKQFRQQETQKLKIKYLELERQVQQQKESELIKNIVRYNKLKQERAQSQVKMRIRQKSNEELRNKEYSQLLEVECQKRIQTEQSIRKLEQKEQLLIQELQTSQQLSSTYSRQLDPRIITKIRAKSYYQS